VQSAMELDELKNIWKNNPAFQRKNEAELLSMLKGGSKSIIDKLKKSVWFELIFTLFAGLLLLIYALTLPDGALKWISVSILALCVFYSFFYIKKLLLLARFNPAEDNLKGSLEKLTDNLTNYLKFYRRSYTILYPVYFLLGLLYGAIERGMDEFLRTLAKPSVILYLSAVALLFFGVSTWFAKWYFKKLYGNHLEKLRILLLDINSHEKAE
jgi:hypothetical protein